MKKYIQPNIKAVILDQEQTVLQVCVIGGFYFKGETGCLVGGPISYTCRTTPKGGATSRPGMVFGGNQENKAS